ncbi:hypothetical protein P4485_26470 [Bacillus thuringiensis]|nr:hypothetical protein [Bacillus thuringiensis]
MKKQIKNKLPLIGAFCLFIVTLVNFFIENSMWKNYVSVSLFLFVLILYFISRDSKTKA